MFLKKINRNRSGVSNIISVILITSLMITSIAITYSYIVPTIDRGRIQATIATSSLFMTKLDSTIQSMTYDGIGSGRTVDIDAYEGTFEFRTFGISLRTYVDGGLDFAPPSLTYGATRISIQSDYSIMRTGAVDYIKGNDFYPVAITEDSNKDPAMITLTKPEGSKYEITLWYRLYLQVRDSGVGGEVDVSVIVVQFDSSITQTKINENTNSLFVNKTSVQVNPSAYGFVDNEPYTSSGSDFYITAINEFGPNIIYRANGARTNINFSIIIVTYGFEFI